MTEKITILSVDDDEIFTELFNIYMEEFDVVIDSAKTIAEAKTIFDPGKQLVLFTDWNLPDGKGADIADFVREKHPDFPLVFYTGAVSDQILEQAKSYAPLAILKKEGGMEHFQEINRLIRERL